MEDLRGIFYNNYRSFKVESWKDHADTFLREAFSIEIKRSKIKPGQKILELGFGNGCFLDWCKEMGFAATGLETNPDMVESAKERGHEAWLGSSPKDAVPQDLSFDLIVAIDVFEHLTLKELLEVFDFCGKALNENGRILARFPNGASPFSRPLQHGDATHVSVLTPKKIEQIAAIHNFKLAGVYNAARPTRGGRRLPMIRKLGYFARDIIAWNLGMVFYGKTFPMDANVTVVLERASSTPES